MPPPQDEAISVREAAVDLGDGRALVVTVSAGVATLQPGEPLEDLLRRGA